LLAGPSERHIPDILSIAAEDMLADETWRLGRRDSNLCIWNLRLLALVLSCLADKADRAPTRSDSGA
jgi:hypothetical protein